jgi:hypothetical protein
MSVSRLSFALLPCLFHLWPPVFRRELALNVSPMVDLAADMSLAVFFDCSDDDADDDKPAASAASTELPKTQNPTQQLSSVRFSAVSISQTMAFLKNSLNLVNNF